MANTEVTIAQAYATFNERDIDSALALMTDDVSWPKASEGGSVVGKEEIRAYWMRQWSEFDPRVEPLAIDVKPDGRMQVRVHQIVKSLSGDVLFDGEVQHIYTLHDGLIAAMQLGDEEGATSAFTHTA